MPAKKIVYIIDDESAHRDIISFWLKEHDYEIMEFSDGEAALTAMEQNPPALVCLDLLMPRMHGIDVLAEIRKKDAYVPVIITTSEDNVETAVRSMRKGATDYLVKPLESVSFSAAFDMALATAKRQRDNCGNEHELKERPESTKFGMIGKSPAMLRFVKLLAKVAQSDVSVMIYGESGTGKELAARAIHEHSSRKEGAFVAMNCAAIAENLVDSELFGHEKGAFTGAISVRQGRFEQADCGTLFLDEVAELSAETQARLLRVLQERRFERVGGQKKLTSDVRIISATNKSLERMVEAKEFRADLYYRLVVFPIRVPSLRERKEDIPLLSKAFLQRYVGDNEKIPEISQAAMDALLTHDYPGNIRELENVIQYACVTASDCRIEKSDLPPSITSDQGLDFFDSLDDEEVENEGGKKENQPQTMADIEKAAIVEAIAMEDGNISKAAKRLGLGRSTLYRKMSTFGLIED